MENLWNHVFVIMLSMTCNLAGGLYDVLAIEAPQLLRSSMVSGLLVVAYASFVATFWLVIKYYYLAIQPYYDLPNAELWAILFDFVVWTVWSKLFFYTLFPMIHCWFHGGYTRTNYSTKSSINLRSYTSTTASSARQFNRAYVRRRPAQQ